MIGSVEIQIGGIYVSIYVRVENLKDLGNIPSVYIYFHWKAFLLRKGRRNVDV